MQSDLFTNIKPCATEVVEYLFQKKIQKRIVADERIIYTYKHSSPVVAKQHRNDKGECDGVLIQKVNFYGQCVFARIYKGVVLS